MSESKIRQSEKLKEIASALIADGFVGLDAQAKALGLSRSTAWTILNGSHKASGLSVATVNRMLAAPLLRQRTRAKILEYVLQKRAGYYGGGKSGLRKFAQRLDYRPIPERRSSFADRDGRSSAAVAGLTVATTSVDLTSS